MQNKIFGIGLPKTGTSSLNSALSTLGFKSIHDPWKFRRKIWETGDYTWSRKFTALTNFGEWFFPQLDKTYPNSKFILTIRDKEEWLESCRKHFSPHNEKYYKRPLESAFKRMEIFGIRVFSADQYSYMYDFHKKTVKDYFKSRKKDLLIMDICAGDGWGKLCSFLDAETPYELFPHKNQRRRHKKDAK